jgi:hypothetical protein
MNSTDDQKRRVSIELSIALLSAIESAREEMGFDSRTEVVNYILSEILLRGIDDAPEDLIPSPTDQWGEEKLFDHRSQGPHADPRVHPGC